MKRQVSSSTLRTLFVALVAVAALVGAPSLAMAWGFHAGDGGDTSGWFGSDGGVLFGDGGCYNPPPPPTEVPEPASLVLLGSGLVGMGLRARRRAGRR